MGFAIMRIQKRDHGGMVAMAKHALRDGVVVANAIPGAPPPPTFGGMGNAKAVREKVAALKSKAIERGQRWRKDQVEAIDVLVTASSADLALWPVKMQDDYFRKALNFVAGRFGGHQNILVAAVHRDESTPHMQILVAPIDERGHFAAKKFIDGPSSLTLLHDEFHGQVGQEFGLDRGEKGSPAKHIPIRSFYAHAAAASVGQAEALEPVPAAPTLTPSGLLNGSYAAAKRLREAVIDRNNGRRKEVQRERLSLRSIHPTIVAREAERYRSVKRMADLAAADAREAVQARMDAQQAVVRLATHSQAVKQEVDQVALGAAIAIARLSRGLDQAAVDALSVQLRISLVRGKDLCDQIRRAGLASNLVDAAKLLDAAAAGNQRPQIDQIKAEHYRLVPQVPRGG